MFKSNLLNVHSMLYVYSIYIVVYGYFEKKTWTCSTCILRHRKGAFLPAPSRSTKTLCYVLPFFCANFLKKMLRNVLSRLTHLEVSLEFPDTLKSTGGLYWGVSTIFSHIWLNYFYAVAKNLKHQNLKNRPKINMLVLRLRSVVGFSRHS